MSATTIAAVMVFLSVAVLLVMRPLVTPPSARRRESAGRVHWPSFAWGAAAALVVVVVALAVVLADRGAPRNATRDPTAPSDAMVAALQNAATRNPRDAQTWLLLARAHFMRGEVAESIAAYSRILEVNPEHAQALAELSLVFYDRRLFDVAHKAADRALALDPNNLSALWVAGQILYRNGEDREAIQVWQRFLRLKPSGPDAEQIRESIAQAQVRLRGR